MMSEYPFVENDSGEIEIDSELFTDDLAFQAWILGTKNDAVELVRRLVRKHLVKTASEAVQALYQASKENPPEELLSIASVDIKGGIYKRPFTQLKKEDGEKIENTEYLRGFGVFLHSIVGSIWTGQFFGHKNSELSEQLAFDFMPRIEYIKLFNYRKLYRPKRITKTFLKRLKRCWEPLARTLGGEWMKNYPKLDGTRLQRLFQILSPFIDENSEKLLKGKQEENGFRYFYTLTMMTLASAILYIGKTGHCGGLREIPILHRKYRFGGWRIDMLRILSVNGNAPTKRHIKIINDLQREKFGSLHDTLFRLRAALNNMKIEYGIYELKFAVGDGTTSRHVIQPNDINGDPLPRHATQVKTYLALANLARGLEKKHPEIWNGSVKFQKVNVVYFFPNMSPVEYLVEANGKAQRDVFFETIYRHQASAYRKSVIRERSNFLVNFVKKSEKSGKILTGRLKKRNGNMKNDTLFERKQLSPYEELLKIVDGHRTFIGPHQIIEQVGDDTKIGGKKSPYRFHLGRFFEKLNEGLIPTGRFDTVRGGFVRCLFPEHWEYDNNPSMMIFLEKSYARCFGCGKWAPFDSNSTPHTFAVNLKSVHKNKIRSLEGLKTIPESFSDSMELIQQILQKFFANSKAEEYIKRVRHLDPQLAYTYGAGFCNEGATHTLLDLFDFEELIHNGLVSFSATLRETQGLYPLLKKRGKTLEKVKRDNGLPFLVLENRVTFPLDFGKKRITSFYGRSILKYCPKKFYHRKTLAKYSQIPQGMFNGEIINIQNGEIAIFEAVLDALTAIQIGYDAGALVGTFNFLALEHLQKFNGKIRIGFDLDAGGNNAKEKTLLWVEQNNIQNIYWDFLDIVAKKYPGVKKYKDLNEWWSKEVITC